MHQADHLPSQLKVKLLYCVGNTSAPGRSPPITTQGQASLLCWQHQCTKQITSHHSSRSSFFIVLSTPVHQADHLPSQLKVKLLYFVGNISAPVRSPSSHHNSRSTFALAKGNFCSLYFSVGLLYIGKYVFPFAHLLKWNKWTPRTYSHIYIVIFIYIMTYIGTDFSVLWLFH